MYVKMTFNVPYLLTCVSNYIDIYRRQARESIYYCVDKVDRDCAFEFVNP